MAKQILYKAGLSREHHGSMYRSDRSPQSRCARQCELDAGSMEGRCKEKRTCGGDSVDGKKNNRVVAGISQFRYIKIQPNTIDPSTRLREIIIIFRHTWLVKISHPEHKYETIIAR